MTGPQHLCVSVTSARHCAGCITSIVYGALRAYQLPPISTRISNITNLSSYSNNYLMNLGTNFKLLLLYYELFFRLTFLLIRDSFFWRFFLPCTCTFLSDFILLFRLLLFDASISFILLFSITDVTNEGLYFVHDILDPLLAILNSLSILNYFSL